MMSSEHVREKFVHWLSKRIDQVGSGEIDSTSGESPKGKYWLGRLQSLEAVLDHDWGDRGERLEPCAIGIIVKPEGPPPWKLNAEIEFHIWSYRKKLGDWAKSNRINLTVPINISNDFGTQSHAEKEISTAILEIVGSDGLSGRIDTEISKGRDGEAELSISFVNTSPKSSAVFKDTRFYQSKFAINGFKRKPFTLESLSDSFRHDRRIDAFGINCDVICDKNGSLRTSDSTKVDVNRPKYWNMQSPPPTLDFLTLSKNPIPSLEHLASLLSEWGKQNWSEDVLQARYSKENWTSEMLASAVGESQLFLDEVKRIHNGISLLKANANLYKAFCGMNLAMSRCSKGYDSWRTFQIGFLLANISSVVDKVDECETVDVVWFATGGGKTETYLGLLITAALHDRLLGKSTGITAWSRFPLRMLSLQQTQRFADAMASAELVRQEMKIKGAPFSLGFFVGMGATPNSIKPDAKPGEPDPDEPTMPEKFKILETCPFCGSKAIKMAFNRLHWKLEHQCENDKCSWKREGLPVYIVDDEIYRFLPTIVVGTLDKAASISMQASMRGMVGSPIGLCEKEGHGYTYAERKSRPNGCLVPGCRSNISDLPIRKELFAPSFRLQDELHLLRDSLGAVDSHYEALYDDLQQRLSGRKPKILASSATLAGYEKQIDVLYRRKARVFPVPPPKIGDGFWTSTSQKLMRHYMAIAPRGVTIEYTVDRVLTELQKIIRQLDFNPEELCKDIGISEAHVDDIISIYGTDVVYGNTLRDLEAVTRSMETQVLVDGNINTASLTGKTEFSEVRETLERLQSPEPSFSDRLHIISASSMMSHGVDVNRLNIMVMLGVPLSAAEFIQATSRVGRTHPALVFVIHKIGRERDAGVFKSFRNFVTQGDRFVDPIPITRRSRQVLERTIAGLELARILMIHEERSDNPLTTIKTFKEYFNSGAFDINVEKDELIKCLDLTSELDVPLKKDLEKWFDEFSENIALPPSEATFVSDLSPTKGPMLSLRDVEAQVPIIGKRI